MKKRISIFPYIMVLPSFTLIAFICLYPVFIGIYMSFTNCSLMNVNKMSFIGLANFISIVNDSEFKAALGFTLIFTVVSVFISYIVGLISALLMNRVMIYRNVFRALLLLPWVVPAVVGTTAWQWILNDQTGIVNTVLKSIGIIHAPILFLSNPLLTKLTVIFFNVWKSFPFMAVVILASLQNIPLELYESAYIDGANSWETFFHITLPMIKRESTVCLTLMTIWTFNNFEFTYLLTKGGPDGATQVMSIYSYYTAFSRCSLGYACAISVTMMVFMILCSQVYFRINADS